MTLASPSADIPVMNPQKIQQVLHASTSSDAELFKLIVDAPFQLEAEAAFLFLGIITLAMVDKKTGMIERMAISDTEIARNSTALSSTPFNALKIPLSHPNNIISRAIRSGQPLDTVDWDLLTTPDLEANQARLSQANAGIAYSAVYPLRARAGGALIFDYFQFSGEIGTPQRDFMHTYTSLVDKLL